jgi:rRNA maturation RNase YbeY
LTGALFIRNRQQAARVDTRQLRRITLALLAELLHSTAPGRRGVPQRDAAAARVAVPATIGNRQSAIGNHSFDLGLYLVGAAEMTRLNETFLRHAGSTDVITFDYADHTTFAQPQRFKPRVTRHVPLHGEIFVCLDEARIQARRFRTTWQAELARYVVHGVLHLLGYDDRRAPDRRKMKREENRLLCRIEHSFTFAGLGRR